MFELFENLTNWLWGLPLLITILATGVYLTVRSGFFQFRHFGYIVKNMFSKERRQEGGDDEVVERERVGHDAAGDDGRQNLRQRR